MFPWTFFPISSHFCHTNLDEKTSRSVQKQSPEVSFVKRCSQNFLKIRWKTSLLSGRLLPWKTHVLSVPQKHHLCYLGDCFCPFIWLGFVCLLRNGSSPRTLPLPSSVCILLKNQFIYNKIHIFNFYLKNTVKEEDMVKAMTSVQI